MGQLRLEFSKFGLAIVVIVLIIVAYTLYNLGAKVTGDYITCTSINKVNIPSNDPDYRGWMDADGDKVACEN